MPTLNSWGNRVSDANVAFTGGTFAAGNDATDNAISIGTSANAGRTVTIGSGTAASSTVIDCGTGALNIGANAVARTTTLGCTTGAGVLALKYGTGDFTLASATGTVMSALDTGEITYPLQPAFLANSSSVSDVTGDGTLYTMVFDNEVFDQNSDFDGTSTFTAPVTGRYYLSFTCGMQGILSTHTGSDFYITTSNRNCAVTSVNLYNVMCNSTILNITGSILADMDAADTAVCKLYATGGTKVIDIRTNTRFSGQLVC